MIAHKHPSALDHAAVANAGAFVGRDRELKVLDDCFTRVGQTRTVAIVADAGSGKTRLVGEWLARHPDLRALRANFGLFGGDVGNFASQLAPLPQDRLDVESLVRAVMERIQYDRVDVLVLDDVHWAGEDGRDFLRSLLVALAPAPVFVILVSRPAGRHLLRALQPAIQLELRPLSRPDVMALARELSQSESVVVEAVRRAGGSPLFVEQFIAWAAETDFQGGESGPRTLHQVVAARIQYLCEVRIWGIQLQVRWGPLSQQEFVDHELSGLETEAGLWLDRLETGDYADRREAAHHLNQLEQLDHAIFITSMMAAWPRPRSSRLREAIERLLIGAAIRFSKIWSVVLPRLARHMKNWRARPDGRAKSWRTSMTGSTPGDFFHLLCRCRLLQVIFRRGLTNVIGTCTQRSRTTTWSMPRLAGTLMGRACPWTRVIYLMRGSRWVVYILPQPVFCVPQRRRMRSMIMRWQSGQDARRWRSPDLTE
jgi:hypothetical protein